MMRPALSLVLPARDEAEALPGLLAEIRRARLPRPLELLVVDDGSKDGSGALAKKARARVLRTEGLGYGGALKLGLHAARGEWLAFMDADGTCSAANLLALWKAKGGKDEMLLLDRMEAGNGMPALRRLGNRLFNAAASFRFGLPVADLCSGQRLFHRSLLPLLAGLPEGLDFSPALTARALARARARWVRGDYRERLGRSKLSILADGPRFLRAALFTR